MAALRRSLGLAFRVLISGGILAYLAYKVNWVEITARLRDAQPGWIFLSVFLMGVTMPLSALRWQTLLRVQEIYPGFARVFQVTMIGQFFNAFLLGTTGGDVVKILYMAKAAPKQRSAAGFSVVADRLIGLVALIIFTLVLTLFQYPHLTASLSARKALWTFYFIAAGVAGVLSLTAALPWLMHFANFKAWEKKVPFHERIERLSEAFRRNAQSIRPTLHAFLISFLTHAITFFAQWCLAVALHLGISFFTMAAVTGVIYVLISIPISISGLGVRESLFILFLGLNGVPSEGAVAVSLLGFVLALIWSFVGGLIHLRYRQPIHIADLEAETIL